MSILGIQPTTTLDPIGFSSVQSPSQTRLAAQSFSEGADAFIAQYSPQIYTVVLNGIVGHGISEVLEANLYNPNIAFPPLPGRVPNLIPSLPPAETLALDTIDLGTQRMIAALRSLSAGKP